MFLHEGGSSAALLIDEFLANVAREVSAEATIFAVTTDTDPSMNAFGKLLEEKKILHLYCTDHVLHLTCKRCYERASFGDVETSAVQKATNVVSHFQSSTQATAKLLQAQSMIDDYNSNVPVTLLTDCVTRWWSTFRMVARILYLRLALSLLEVNNDIPETKRLTGGDWKELESVHKVLNPFRNAQLSLEGEKYVSSSFVVATVHTCRASLQDGQSVDEPESIKQMCKTMSKDFDERWGSADSPIYSGQINRGYRSRQVGIHPAFLIATFLHPSFKSMNGMGVDEQSKDRLMKDLVTMMMATFPSGDDGNTSDDDDDDVEETNAVAPVQIDPIFQILEQNAAAATGESDDDDDLESDVRHQCEIELNKYKKSKTKIPKDGNYPDALAWWKKSAHLYPRLASLARKYLSIQATSAPSERIFSKASRIIEEQRTRLDPGIAGKLLYVAFNYTWYIMHDVDPEDEE